MSALYPQPEDSVLECQAEGGTATGALQDSQLVEKPNREGIAGLHACAKERTKDSSLSLDKTSGKQDWEKKDKLHILLEDSLCKGGQELLETFAELTKVLESKVNTGGWGWGWGPLTQEFIDRMDRRTSALEDRQTILQNILAVRTRELERLGDQWGDRERLRRSEERIALLEKQLQQQESALALKDLLISDMESRLLLAENTSYNGSFIWRISNMNQILWAAQTGKTTAIESPSFYTDRYGYRLCMKLYPNGDGAGKGSHLSLFLVILQGEHDFMLQWPFLHKVEFVLLDQQTQQHASASFKPVNSAPFRQPVSEKNTASGLPQFYPLSQLQASGRTFIKDDNMFIKAVIDTRKTER
ncbi:TNF receptor-associated factor 1-like [Polyodon spathula]|uniref:TNF receptor-associated factor 1-like n=1 Tax=Polyodon spathula TaxID=7913 RepID=UPI001B7F091B|nr:TNF receptor-associated factor 1-like [Polyodon spathula]